MLNVENILVARDFSDAAQAATRYALALAARTGATLHTLYAEVLHGDPFDPSEEPATAADKIRARLKQATERKAREAYDPASVRLVHAVRRDVAAAPALLRYADEEAIDLIVMGTHGRRGLRRLALGSVAEEVMRQARCPVLVAGRQTGGTRGAPGDAQAAPEIARVLVPVGFSEHSRAALRHARALAGLYEARLDLFHAVEETLHPAFYSPSVQSVYDVRPDIEEQAEAQLEDLYRTTPGPATEVTFGAGPGRAPQAIGSRAEATGADLIVMSTHGRTALRRLAMGSVAENVVRRAPCPVLVTKSFGHSLVEEPGEEASDQARHSASHVGE